MVDLRGKRRIETPRLTLRPFSAEDAPALVSGVGEFEVSRWLGPVPHPYGPQDAKWFLETMAGGAHYWAICLEGKLIGAMSIDGEFGYWLARSAWGQGFATEAGFAVIDRWFRDPAAPDLPSGHFDDNLRSGAVLGKLGFEYTQRGMLFCRARGQEFASRRMVLSRARWQARQSLPELHTPRCVLRPLAPEDAEDLARIGGVHAVARNTSSIPSPWPVEEARAWIGQGQWQGTPGFRLAICDRSGALIGMAGLTAMDDNGVAGLAYLLKQELWGRGIVTEVMSRFVPAAFRAFPLTAIEADHDTDNPASGAVLRKLGFLYTGDRITGPTRLRLEPTPVSHYRLERSSFEAST